MNSDDDPTPEVPPVSDFARAIQAAAKAAIAVVQSPREPDARITVELFMVDLTVSNPEANVRAILELRKSHGEKIRAMRVEAPDPEDIRSLQATSTGFTFEQSPTGQWFLRNSLSGKKKRILKAVMIRTDAPPPTPAAPSTPRNTIG